VFATHSLILRQTQIIHEDFEKFLEGLIFISCWYKIISFPAQAFEQSLLKQSLLKQSLKVYINKVCTEIIAASGKCNVS